MCGQHQVPAALPQAKPDILFTECWAIIGAGQVGTETQRNERNGNPSVSEKHIRHRSVNSRTSRCATKSALTYYTELHVHSQFGVHEFSFFASLKLSFG